MTPAPLDADRVVDDRYVLEALIGRGGMGEVWRARHLALQSVVAIKFLRGAGDPSERARRRFLTEAQVTANLRTRHAVQVFDFGVTGDGLPYLVMELLDGETLDERIDRFGRLSVADTARILQKAARALDRAHALGIVHRDFKPENVMLVPDDEEGEQVKVVDFGIAKLVGDLDHTLKSALSNIAMAMRPRGSADACVTSGGVGTPQYMAPEQVQDAPHVGPAVDIWAFGVVAYECLTGYRPFDDESVGKLLSRVLAAAPPPLASRIAPVPPAFDDWFRKACARSPADRFPDIQTAAAALVEALEAHEERRGGTADESVEKSPASPPAAKEAEGAAPPPSSPLAATMEPIPPGPISRDAPALVSPPSARPEPVAPPAPPASVAPRAPRLARLTRPAIGAALLIATLAALLAWRAPREQIAEAPVPIATTPKRALPQPRAPEPDPVPVEPAVATSRVDAEPPVPTNTPPAAPPPRAPISKKGALPPVYRLPPLGL